jgi:predicted transcriptional regulator
MTYHLRTWIAEARPSKAAVARELDVSAGTVSDWLSGRRKPGRAVAAKLERISGGRVPVDCWDIEE